MLYVIKHTDLHNKYFVYDCPICGVPEIVELEFYLEEWDLGRIFYKTGEVWAAESEVQFKNRTK